MCILRGIPMTADDLVTEYRAALREATLPLEVWRVLADLATRTLDGLDPEADSDRLLFEVSTGWTFDRQDGVQIDVTREVQREDEEVVYVTCSFAFDTPADRVRDVQVSGAPGEHAARWVAEVEATPAFALLATPARASVVDSRPRAPSRPG
jgi:hypothetical protein